MRVFSLFLILISAASIKCQEWQKLDLESFGMKDAVSIESHRGVFLVSNFNVINPSQQLWKSNDGVTDYQWVETDPLPSGYSIEKLTSAGTVLYSETYQPTKNLSLVWRSFDNGESWDLDTAGMLNSNRVMYFDAMFDGSIICQKQGDDVYQVRLMEGEWGVLDTFYKNNNDPLAFTTYSSKVYAVDPLGAWKADSPTGEYERLGKSGLPSYNTYHDIAVHQNNIYLIGQEYQQPVKLYKSTDGGETWSVKEFEELQAKNSWNQWQSPKAFFVLENRLYLSLSNDEAGSALDLLYSEDGGETWVKNSAGFEDDPNGTDAVAKMVSHNGKIFALTALGDLYYQELASSSIKNLSNEEFFTTYPNPCNDIIKVNAFKPMEVSLEDLNGRVVRKFVLNAKENQLDVSDISEGVYLIRSNSFSSKLIIR